MLHRDAFQAMLKLKEDYPEIKSISLASPAPTMDNRYRTKYVFFVKCSSRELPDLFEGVQVINESRRSKSD
jgi:hypothetical protein